MNTVMTALWLIAGGSFLYAAYTDSQTMRISNWISLLVMGLYAVRWLVSPETTDPVSDFLVFAATLALGFALFAMKGFGGGDVKLMAAGALWFGHASAFTFLVSTGLGGGALALAAIVIHRTPRTHDILARYAPALLKQRYVPYALAIAAGAAPALYEQMSSWSLVQ